jgi:amidase
MDDDEVLFRPVTELAELVRDGEVSARELTEISLARIEALDPQINAFTHVDADGALAAADAIAPGDPRPFAGVPIAIKDNMPVEGLPLTFCADLFGDFGADHDATYVRRLREAGFVIVGKTALPEYGILPTTESRRNGPTRNPWDLGRTPGGSSGGSAAAVAAGMVPIAHGNDGGGSTRIPAACCGLVGLKLTRGRASWGPDLGESFLVTNGVLTRTVLETARILDLTSGYELGDATWAPDPPEPFAVSAGRDPGRLRIGITSTAALDSVELDPECERAYREGAELLSSLGHEVEEFTPPWSAPGLLELFSASFGPGVASTIGFASIVAGRPPAAEDMEDLSWYLWERASELSSQYYLLAMMQLQGFARRVVAESAAYDAILTPALAERPLELGLVNGVTDDPAGTFRRSGQFTPYTAIANTTGQPAISLPLRHGDDGLPAAIQLIGRPAGEGQLLALAAQLEAARPWAERRAHGKAARSPSGLA